MQESHTIAQLQWKRKCTDTYRQQQQQQQQPLFTPYMNTTSGVCMKQNQNSQRRSQIITMKYENKKHRHRWWPRNWVQINRRYRVDRRIISAWGWNQVKIKKKIPRSVCNANINFPSLGRARVVLWVFRAVSISQCDHQRRLLVPFPCGAAVCI